MTVHKLSAGDGYTYLTRQVAAGDAPLPAGAGLSGYYTTTGNPPGRWAGAGAEALGLSGPVSESQMANLYGKGCHPDADRLVAERLAAGEPAELAERAGRLGRTFSAVADRTGRRAVAGYDLVFSPVKSASLLWALGDARVQAAVAGAHAEAVADTLAWLGKQAAFTRTGAGGLAQIDTTGLIVACFDHPDSRLAQPDLHTHAVVSNKVRGVDGVWRALDGRALYHAGVAASERYNSRFEAALSARLPVAFAARADTVRADKRPVREVAGVPDPLIRHFSARRAAVEGRYERLLADYQATHGHAPSRPVQVRLAQQATLDTRGAKRPPRALAEQRASWRADAERLLGPGGVDGMLRTVLHPPAGPAEAPAPDVDALASLVVARVQGERATWTRWNLLAEAERLTRPLRLAGPPERDRLVAAIADRAAGAPYSLRLAGPAPLAEPAGLRRADGASVFTVHGADRYTSPAILSAEDAVLAAAVRRTGRAIEPARIAATLAGRQQANGAGLQVDQAELVRRFCGDDAGIVVAIGPAGAGKTTALRAVAAVCAADGRALVGLAPSAKAAAVLAAQVGVPTDTLHHFLYAADPAAATAGSTTPSPAPAAGGLGGLRLRAGDLIVVDEAGMAGTLRLALLAGLAERHGVLLRLLGDPAQLAAVEAGGALRLLAADTDPVRLTGSHRFSDPAEAAATLALRAGDPAVIDFYAAADRIRDGSPAAMLDAAYTGWAADVAAGRTSVLIAAANAGVAALNARARTDRVAAGQVEAAGVRLADGSLAGVGDQVVSRANQRRLAVLGGRDRVKNGDLWRVVDRHADGSLSVAHLGHGGRVRLPAGYVAGALQLGYATTAHRIQGDTVESAHTLVTAGMTRQTLYVASSRARARTTWYVATGHTLQPDLERPPDGATAAEVLAGVLARDGEPRSATETLRAALADAESGEQLAARYDHALAVAAAQHYQKVARDQLPPAVAEVLLADPAWPTLARTLAAAEAAGCPAAGQLPALLTDPNTTTVRPDGAADVAGAVRRLERHLQADHGGPAAASRTGGGRTPPPAALAEPWANYLKTAAELLARRAAEEPGPSPARALRARVTGRQADPPTQPGRPGRPAPTRKMVPR